MEIYCKAWQQSLESSWFSSWGINGETVAMSEDLSAYHEDQDRVLERV